MPFHKECLIRHCNESREFVPTAAFTADENMVPIFDDIENIKKNIKKG